MRASTRERVGVRGRFNAPSSLKKPLTSTLSREAPRDACVAGTRVAGEGDPRVESSRLEHDPEKWVPVFGRDHAPARSLRGAALDLRFGGEAVGPIRERDFRFVLDRRTDLREQVQDLGAEALHALDADRG